jgi:single-strand DNA-binding protein
MNNLNSVLIEGVVDGDPVIDKDICCLRIISKRYFYDPNGHSETGPVRSEETSYFNIQVPGKLGVTCKRLGSNGCGVRVVGRLKQDRLFIDGKEQSGVVIVADHLEFRPEPKSKEFK